MQGAPSPGGRESPPALCTGWIAGAPPTSHPEAQLLRQGASWGPRGRPQAEWQGPGPDPLWAGAPACSPSETLEGKCYFPGSCGKLVNISQSPEDTRRESKEQTHRGVASVTLPAPGLQGHPPVSYTGSQAWPPPHRPLRAADPGHWHVIRGTQPCMWCCRGSPWAR